MVTITHRPGELAINGPYNKDFIDALKQAVPPRNRAWVKPSWVITPEYNQVATDLVIAIYGELPVIRQGSPIISSNVNIKLEFLGRCKEENSNMASGFVNNSWSVLFKEEALRSFFGGSKITDNPSEQSYYEVLGISRDTDPDDIKKAFRRLSKQWHPDVNRGDPDAEEMFKKINEANSILSDPIKRKKYNFILSLENDYKEPPKAKSLNHFLGGYSDRYGYRAPLKCGSLTVSGTQKIGRLIVDSISRWDDIFDDQNRLMVVSWKKDAKSFDIHWV